MYVYPVHIYFPFDNCVKPLPVAHTACSYHLAAVVQFSPNSAHYLIIPERTHMHTHSRPLVDVKCHVDGREESNTMRTTEECLHKKLNLLWHCWYVFVCVVVCVCMLVGILKKVIGCLIMRTCLCLLSGLIHIRSICPHYYLIIKRYDLAITHI